MRRPEFERVVQRALAGLPAAIRQRVRNVAIVVEEFPPARVVKEMALESPYELLGLYQGIPFDKRGFYYGNVLPDRISLYSKPIEARCRSRREMIRLIQEVVLHELGHYFGLDDEELERLLEESR